MNQAEEANREIISRMQKLLPKCVYDYSKRTIRFVVPGPIPISLDQKIKAMNATSMFQERNNETVVIIPRVLPGFNLIYILDLIILLLLAFTGLTIFS